jgi:hypothetical protein
MVIIHYISYCVDNVLMLTNISIGAFINKSTRDKLQTFNDERQEGHVIVS